MGHWGNSCLAGNPGFRKPGRSANAEMKDACTGGFIHTYLRNSQTHLGARKEVVCDTGTIPFAESGNPACRLTAHVTRVREQEAVYLFLSSRIRMIGLYAYV
jgi:hypothetical protein